MKGNSKLKNCAYPLSQGLSNKLESNNDLIMINIPPREFSRLWVINPEPISEILYQISFHNIECRTIYSEFESDFYDSLDKLRFRKTDEWINRIEWIIDTWNFDIFSSITNLILTLEPIILVLKFQWKIPLDLLIETDILKLKMHEKMMKRQKSIQKAIFRYDSSIPTYFKNTFWPKEDWKGYIDFLKKQILN